MAMKPADDAGALGRREATTYSNWPAQLECVPVGAHHDSRPRWPREPEADAGGGGSGLGRRKKRPGWRRREVRRVARMSTLSSYRQRS